MHHARNPRYLDRNYAGTLIIWDRMFGTFQAEEEEPVFGLTKPLDSWNPLWANLHVWRDLFRDAWLAPRWVDKLRIWFMPQGWRPEGLPANPPAPEVTPRTVVPYDTRVPRGLDLYAMAHFAAAVPMTVGLMAAGDDPAACGGGRRSRAGPLGPAESRRDLRASPLGLALRVAEAAGDGRGPGDPAARRPLAPPALAGLLLAVLASWLCLLAYRRQFDGSPQSPGRLIARPAARPGVSEHPSAVEAVAVPITDVGGR